MRTNQTTCLGMRQQEQKSEWRHGYDQNNKVNQFKIIELESQGELLKNQLDKSKRQNDSLTKENG